MNNQSVPANILAQQIVNQVRQTSYTAMMYYNGTNCPWVMDKAEDVACIKEESESMIRLGLMMGEGIKDQRRVYKEQLDSLEEVIYKGGSLCQRDMIFWWMNVYALIRLGALKTDDNNGPLIFMGK